MSRIPAAFALAFAQLGDPRIVRVLAKSLLMTIAIFVLAAWLGSYAFDWAGARLGIDEGTRFAGLLAVIAAIVAAWLLFRVVALAVLQFFADDVVIAVEERHYPAAAASARRVPLVEDLANALKSTARTLLVNLAALPVAILLLATGVGTALLFWAVNAWLLGIELQEMAWRRHRLFGQTRPPLDSLARFGLGGIVAALLVVPFVNLLAPVLGAAAATHLVHRRRGANAA
ncbi:MAG: EI24 domain-containing protein [Tsuneonella sp.]